MLKTLHVLRITTTCLCVWFCTDSHLGSAEKVKCVTTFPWSGNQNFNMEADWISGPKTNTNRYLPTTKLRICPRPFPRTPLPTYVTTMSFDPFFHEFWTSTTRQGSAFHSAGYRGSPFPCTALYWCSPYCTYTYKLAERSGVESREQHEGKWAQGNASQPASSGKQPTAHNRRRKTATCLALSCNMSC